MYDHIGLKVKDIAKSVRFYGAALGPLGHVLASSDASGAGFGPPGAPALWLYLDKSAAAGGTHVAFRAGANPTGIRAVSFRDLISTTETSFVCSLAT